MTEVDMKNPSFDVRIADWPLASDIRSGETTIILCGGPINYSNLPIGTNLSNAMIPVNGKPVIGWILDDLLAKGITDATVVLREQDLRLRRFLTQAYPDRMGINEAPLSAEGGSIVHSLQTGLRRTRPDGTVRIILGDTLIRDSFVSEQDFVYTGVVEDSRRWCLAITDDSGRVVEYLDKQVKPSGPSTALAGYYHLTRGEYLTHCVEAALEDGERELSDVLRRYSALQPIVAHPVQDWYDFGHIDHLVDARRRLLQPRFFNSLTINPVLNTITKVSANDEKLRDELNWYLNIPDDLKVLTPRIIRHEAQNGRVEIVQEYYGYPTLAELYVYGDLQADSWISILKRVLRIHEEFRRFPGQLENNALETMYLQKTWDRLDALRQDDPEWAGLLDLAEIEFNGRRLRNIYQMKDAVRLKAKALVRSSRVSVIHGDFCFSNIMFDVNNQIIRLIDPRGSFGKKGVYGDPSYDIAKLRHSVSGLYDFIVSDMFQLDEKPEGKFRGQVYANGLATSVADELDRMIVAAGYDLDEIRFIEGLLFVSMPPLHKGRKRQLMMYLTGLSLLNEVFENADSD